MRFHTLLLIGTSLSLAVSASAAPSGPPKFAPWGVDLTASDASVKPGDDFFAFVNGAWDKRTTIAEDRSFAGIDSVLNDQIEKDVRSIIEDQAKDPRANGVLGQQVGDFYASFMDEAAIEALGNKPLKPYLARIAAVKDRAGLATLFGSTGYASPIGMFFEANPDDPTRYAVFATQSGLGMPGRDYYLLPGAKYDAFRKAYRDYVIRIQTLAPGLDWDAFLAAQQITNPGKIIVREKDAIAAESALVASQPIDVWKDYLAYRFASSSAPFLSKDFVDTNFDFFSKTLRDVPTNRPRWKRGVDIVNGALGEGVGQIYVQRHYPPESDRQMSELITDVRAALKDKIENSSWMDAATKKEALAKLAAFDPRTGHPVKYIDYSTMVVKRGDLLGNVMRANEFEEKRQLALFPKPIDRTLWGMLPQTNNAYYDPSTNQITFPAAILQPPYFDPRADPAANYGSIGATIGHEIGHGFDDQGRLYDGSGKLRDWWTPASAKAYGAQTAALVKQYDQYQPIPGTNIKGQLTLGENIGDLGGLEVAYAAYRRYVAKHGEPPVIGGLTGDQRFFIAYGYSWESKFREGVVRNQLLNDPHSPAKFRVNGVVRNMDAWYKAFNVQPGDKLYLAPEQRVHIW
jgi:endothelin-converting enzyme/putative endopeptidase